MSQSTQNEVLDSILDNDKSPSVSYIFFDQNQIIHFFQKGKADISNQRNVTENTSYCAYSVTKTFTALAILQLAEKGKLSLNDKAKDHIEFPYSDKITIKQLLSHSAGIPSPLPLKWVHSSEEHENFNRKDFFKKIYESNKKEKFKPNEKFAYSNLGYVFLGEIIEKLSGLTYEEYIQKHIIKAIKLDENELGFDVVNKADHAKGYQKRWTFMNFLLGFLMDKSKYVDQKEGNWNSFHDMYLNGPSHGGLIGKPASFMRYVQELLKDDCILLSNEYKNLMFSENLTNSGRNTGMCLSWFKGELNGKTYYSHAGGGPGYYCEIRIYPEEGLGSVVMFNRSGMRDERILSQIDKYFFEDTRN